MTGKWKIFCGVDNKRVDTILSTLQSYAMANTYELEVTRTPQDILLVYHNSRLIGDFDSAMEYIEGISGGYGDNTV